MSRHIENILLVEDDEAFLEKLHSLLRSLDNHGYQIAPYHDFDKALDAIKTTNFDLAIIDVNLPHAREKLGIRLAQALRRQHGDHPYIYLVTGDFNEDLAEAAWAVRPDGFLLKTKWMYKPEWWHERLLDAERKVRDRSYARLGERTEADALKSLVGNSRPMQTVREAIRKAAPRDIGVLIRGESGTGKELVARAIHDASQRRNGPFISLNIAALPSSSLERELFGHVGGVFANAVVDKPGPFEMANGGTIFLDEIGDASPDCQTLLLRVLQESKVQRVGDIGNDREIDVRVIAATNKDLGQAIKKNAFREDLFFRLNKFPIFTAPLRDRAEDIPALCEALGTREFPQSPPLRWEPKAIEELQHADLPGNIRQLLNVLEVLDIEANGQPISPALVRKVIMQSSSTLETPTTSHRTHSNEIDLEERDAGMALTRLKTLPRVERSADYAAMLLLLESLKANGNVLSKAGRLLGDETRDCSNTRELRKRLQQRYPDAWRQLNDPGPCE